MSRLLRGNLPLGVGALIVGTVMLLGILAPVIAPYGSTEAIPEDFLQPPNTNHLLGTDQYGMDVLSRVIWSARIDLIVAFSATLVSVVVGTFIGLLIGFFEETATVSAKASEGGLRLLDIIQAFPPFVLALALVAASGPNVTNIVAVIAFINIPVFARLTRSAVMSIKSAPYVEAARISGASNLYIIRRHILRNAIDPSLINASVVAGLSILLTAGLSFIGAGVREPTPEWGSMISIGAQYVATGQWWPSVFPGIALGATVFGFALLGAGLQRLLDPPYEVGEGSAVAIQGVEEVETASHGTKEVER